MGCSFTFKPAGGYGGFQRLGSRGSSGLYMRVYGDILGYMGFQKMAGPLWGGFLKFGVWYEIQVCTRIPVYDKKNIQLWASSSAYPAHE